MQFYYNFIDACQNVYFNIKYFCSLNLFGMLKYLFNNINTVLYIVIAGTITYFLLRLFVFKEKKSSVHGSAAWGDIDDLEKQGLVKRVGEGTILGKKDGKYICSPLHTIVCAKTRGGKGVGCIIPTLLTYKKSAIVLDVKGENYIITSRRREQMGQDVFCFDPFLMLGNETHCFNPLVYINESSPRASADAKKVAHILMSQVAGSEPFFDLSAETFIQCAIMYVCANYNEKDRNLVEVRKLLASDDMKELLDKFIASESYKGILKYNAKLLLLNINKQTGELTDTINGIILSMASAMAFLDDENISYALSKNDFDLRMFRYTTSTLYVVFSPDDIENSAVILQLVYSFALSMNIKHKEPIEAKEAGLKQIGNVLFVLDEFAQLGKFTQLKKAISLVGGVGVSMMIVIQSLSQLEEHYDKGAGELKGNSVKLFIGCEDDKTAEYISKMAGTTTVKTYSEDHKGKRNFSFMQRDLITVGEAVQLDIMKPIIILGGMKPTKIERITYYEDRDFKGKYDKSPTQKN